MSGKNKSKSKVPRPRQGQNTGISFEKYEEVYRAYLDDQSIPRVARKCGVDRRTVKRYVEHGDPARGLRSIRERFAEVVRKAQALEDDNLARARAEGLAMVSRFQRALEAKIEEYFAGDGMTLTAEASDALPADLSSQLERTIKLRLSLQGAPDVTNDAGDSFEGWTDDEVTEWAESGEAPARLQRGG